MVTSHSAVPLLRAVAVVHGAVQHSKGVILQIRRGNIHVLTKGQPERKGRCSIMGLRHIAVGCPEWVRCLLVLRYRTSIAETSTDAAYWYRQPIGQLPFWVGFGTNGIVGAATARELWHGDSSVPLDPRANAHLPHLAPHIQTVVADIRHGLECPAIGHTQPVLPPCESRRVIPCSWRIGQRFTEDQLEVERAGCPRSLAKLSLFIT